MLFDMERSASLSMDDYKIMKRSVKSRGLFTTRKRARARFNEAHVRRFASSPSVIFTTEIGQ